MKIKKICIVGYGDHVKNTIIPSLSLNEKNIKIVTTKNIKSKFFIYKSLKLALKSLSKDFFFYNSTPPSIHYKLSKLILTNKFNLIVEKPICMNSSQLTKLKVLASNNNLILFENMMYFHSKQFNFFNKFIAKKNDFETFKINFTIPSFNKSSFRNNTDINSSLIYDVACYPFSLISFLGFKVGKFNTIINYKKDIISYLNIIFFSKNVKFDITVSFYNSYKNYCKIYFRDKSSIKFNYFFYGKKMVKKNILTLPNNKINILEINDLNAFSKIFNFKIDKLNNLSDNFFPLSKSYLDTLNRVKKNIKL